jgi:hypothetical protein
VLFGIARGIHLLAVIVAIGGAFGLRYAVLPALEGQPEEVRRRLHAAMRRRLMAITLTAIAMLVLSGSVNLIRAFVVAPRPPAAYHMVLGVKLLLALALFTVAAWQVAPSDPPNALQRHRRRTSGFIVHLGVLIVMLSVALRFLSGK